MLAETAEAAGHEVALASLPVPPFKMAEQRELLDSLSTCDVILTQFNAEVWGKHKAAENFSMMKQATQKPVFTTLHDTQHLPLFRPPVSFFRSVYRKLFRLKRNVQAGNWSGLMTSAHHVLDEIVKCSDGLFVFYDQEKSTLIKRYSKQVTVVPHFVESVQLPDANEAKTELCVADKFVMTVLGYINPRKGHDLALEAIQSNRLGNCHLFLAGAANNADFEKQLRTTIAENELGDQVTITGYLENELQKQVMAATDLALCPFRSLAASGSLATWVAAGKPILATRLPQTESILRLSEGAFKLVDSSVSNWTSAILEFREQSEGVQEQALSNLREALSLKNVWKMHEEVLTSCHAVGGTK